MKRTVIIGVEARNDVATAHNNYLTRDSKRAQEFVVALEEALLHIEANPRAYALRPHGMRRFNFKRFPFALLYVVVESEDEDVEKIVIIGCIHERQNDAPFVERLNP